ncbi:hypothetical protein ROZALSC1DRAFT_30172 [Rozella allomycis CSF55]|uniref:Prefoldin subunit 2 domain-containing protein n=1 Tax=Rozella allomycis (strain CSF55) TaxID=988480 RepID=A0A075B3T5_ROZAC|nr:Prefoldin subunit 2 domain-containing protein [Rozella allomycis CSF55]RKP18090.1 hypothetical protein ROZALSC1DRAFT_30172 [Rozella allomycis CSF55]|eukprot:EPZ35742.1 Prefoldin subunit 2 domain-containing protein [Rozella allomycis CSF55]
MNGDRRCFRLVGGVLVERTVSEVIPALKKNTEGIDEIIKGLHETFKKKEIEFVRFQEQYQITERAQ